MRLPLEVRLGKAGTFTRSLTPTSIQPGAASTWLSGLYWRAGLPIGNAVANAVERPRNDQHQGENRHPPAETNREEPLLAKRNDPTPPLGTIFVSSQGRHIDGLIGPAGHTRRKRRRALRRADGRFGRNPDLLTALRTVARLCRPGCYWPAAAAGTSRRWLRRAWMPSKQNRRPRSIQHTVRTDGRHTLSVTVLLLPCNKFFSSMTAVKSP